LANSGSIVRALFDLLVDSLASDEIWTGFDLLVDSLASDEIWTGIGTHSRFADFNTDCSFEISFF